MTVRAPKCRDQVAVESAQPSSAAGSSDKARGRYHRFCAADPAAPAAFARMPPKSGGASPTSLAKRAIAENIAMVTDWIHGLCAKRD